VLKDVSEINAGKATSPSDIDYKGEINRLKFYEIALLYIGPAIVFVIFLLSARLFAGQGLLLIGGVAIFYAYITPELKRKYQQKIRWLTYESNQVEWLINGRVYGEHINDAGETVLYPKRGQGFYTLTPLEYLYLYTLQFHDGDYEKGDNPFHNLRKSLISNGTIKSREMLTTAEKQNIISIYDECKNAKIA
jgi:hypothetical protein